MSDIRVQTTFFDHRKTKRLKRRCGLEGVICLQRLWAFAAGSKQHGFLNGMTVDEIEEEAGWEGEVGTFFNAITDQRISYLDTFENVPNLFYLHDWHQWQPYVVTGILRTWQARFNAYKKHEKNEQTIIKMIGEKPEIDYRTLLHFFTKYHQTSMVGQKAENDRLTTAQQSASIKERTAQQSAENTERIAEPPLPKTERTGMLSSPPSPPLFSSSSGSISGTSSSSLPEPEQTAASGDAAEEKDTLQKGVEDEEKTKSENSEAGGGFEEGTGKPREIINDGWKTLTTDEKYTCAAPKCGRENPETIMVNVDTGYCATCQRKFNEEQGKLAGKAEGG